MKLYRMVPQDSSGKANWLLNELGLDFETVQLSYRNGDLKTPEFLQKNPLGQIPVLEDGSVVISESYAILAYLADKYSDKGLSPDPKDHTARAQYYQWLLFASNSAEDFFGRYYRLPSMTEEYKKDWEAYTKDKTQKVLATIEKQLQEKDYLLGSFSAADIAVTYALNMVSEESFLSDYPLTKAYYTRLINRPACVKSEVFKA